MSALSSVSLTHRYAEPFRDLYLETEAIGRYRTDGGPTLGLQHILTYRPTRPDVSLRLSGTGFMQLPTQGTDLAASGTLRLAASRSFDLGPQATHLPSWSLLARWLSLDASRAEASEGRIDLDVFSEFKADHRAGLILSDTFFYQSLAGYALVGAAPSGHQLGFQSSCTPTASRFS